MISSRIGLLTRTLSRFSLHRLATFSSSSAAHPRFSSFFSDETEDGSAVYRHTLKFQRPTTIEWDPNLLNSVNFIGSVDSPLRINKKGVYTSLKVKGSLRSHQWFRILMAMQGDMATLGEEHLKPDDFIYVSGFLGSYAKVDGNGNQRINYKVDVKEFNYVKKRSHMLTNQKSEEPKSGGEAGMERYENRLYLWHVFFSNPYEWWDNRKDKKSPRAPDFKHKDTREALWLSPNDPPWIKKQLELIDSKMAKQGLGDRASSRSGVSTWVYDEDFGSSLEL